MFQTSGPKSLVSNTPRSLCCSLLVLGLVVYVSLVPLDFKPLPLAEALARFKSIAFLELGMTARADWVANGVLCVPVGLLTALMLLGSSNDRGVHAIAAIAATFFCWALAFGFER